MQPPSDVLRLAEFVQVGAQHDELVRAEPTHNVAWSRGARKPLGRLDQEAVTFLMPERVNDVRHTLPP
jgi:hypothetical protein